VRVVFVRRCVRKGECDPKRQRWFLALSLSLCVCVSFVVCIDISTLRTFALVGLRCLDVVLLYDRLEPARLSSLIPIAGILLKRLLLPVDDDFAELGAEV
jgi:hypothetical protein